MQYWMVAASGMDRVALELMVEEVKSQVPEELMMTGRGMKYKATMEGSGIFWMMIVREGL
jgi:hypothetical protein